MLKVGESLRPYIWERQQNHNMKVNVSYKQTGSK